MLHGNLKQSVFFQFANNNNYMNMAEANNAFFAASEVSLSWRVCSRFVCDLDHLKGLKGEAEYQIYLLCGIR